jgi:hypothetical protein
MTTYLYITENCPPVPKLKLWKQGRTFEAAQKYALNDGRFPQEIYKYDIETLKLVKILRPIRIEDGCCGKYEFEDESEED